MKISTIIPCYNSEDTIQRAVQSVLNQTRPSFEIILCDDGSTDNTKEVIKKIEDKRIKYFRISHTGLPAVVRNFAVKKSQGDWLAFLDGDDEWLEEKLAIQVEYAHNYGAISTNGYRVNEGENKLFFSEDRKTLDFKEMLKENRVITSSLIVQREVFKKAGGFPENKKLVAIEDYALWLKISSFSKIRFISKPLVRYNDNQKSGIRKKGPPTFNLQKREAIKEYIKWKVSIKSFDGNFILSLINYTQTYIPL